MNITQQETVRDIILVDDHVVIRSGLKELVEKLGPYKISREYDNGRQLVQALPLHPLPDLIIMDISMPEMNGDEVMNILQEKELDYPVLILTLNHDEQRLVRLFRTGVRGYLEKNCTAATLREALEEIFRCGFYHNEMLSFALRVIEKPQKTIRDKILDQLSARELEFIKLVCHEEEYTYEQIADLMHVVHRTVDGYRQSIFEKFGIKSKTGLVLFAIRNKLFEL
ncbi:response regulator transcription factor [Chitinophagaceae bacterium MMS25-I14]